MMMCWTKSKVSPLLQDRKMQTSCFPLILGVKFAGNLSLLKVMRQKKMTPMIIKIMNNGNLDHESFQLLERNEMKVGPGDLISRFFVRDSFTQLY